MKEKRRNHPRSPSQDSAATRRPTENHPRLLASAVLVVMMTAIAYYPSLSGDFIFDDTGLLIYNPLIKAADGLYRFWFTAQGTDYWPVFNSVLWLEWRLWGMHPSGYHAVNLVLSSR